MMMQARILTTWSAGVAMLIAAAAVTVAANDPRAPLQGVWRTVEVVVATPTPQVFKPSATLAIFHGSYYSRVEIHAEGPRTALKNPAAATADELREAWGPFVGEAGTFEVGADGVLTMRAMVAKNPAAMANGAASVFTYRRNGDTLVLTQVRTPAGPSAVPMTITLSRVE
jgi:hypothetical protein